MTDEARPSAFVEELEGKTFAGLVASDGAAARVPCPKCGGGSLVVRRGDFGVFWGCTGYPYCDGKADACPQCGRGAFARVGGAYRCSSAGCGHEVQACPRCPDGMLRRREGQYGVFWGCSNWRPELPSCGYTRGIGHPSSRRRR